MNGNARNASTIDPHGGAPRRSHAEGQVETRAREGKGSCGGARTGRRRRLGVGPEVVQRICTRRSVRETVLQQRTGAGLWVKGKLAFEQRVEVKVVVHRGCGGGVASRHGAACSRGQLPER